MATQAEYWQEQAMLAKMSNEEKTVYGEEQRRAKEKANENAKRKKAENLAQCYEAEINESGKYRCPNCKNVEGGSLRVITHNYGCKYKGKPYCQQTSTVLGGKRKTRKIMKNKRRRRSNSSRK